MNTAIHTAHPYLLSVAWTVGGVCFSIAVDKAIIAELCLLKPLETFKARADHHMETCCDYDINYDINKPIYTS